MKGFTLIELLAVIVILAIILLIAMPLIGNVIEGVKASALESSSKNLLKAAEYLAAEELVKGNEGSILFTIEDGAITSVPAGKELEFKGEIPKNGKLRILKGGLVIMALYEDGKCITKGYGQSDMEITLMPEDECELPNQYTHYDIAKGVNAPDLTAGMIAVEYNGSNWIKVADPENDVDWYDYNTKKWANAVYVKETTRAAYLAAADGTVINMTDIVTFFVWIPRYAYSITTNYHTLTAGNVAVKFLVDATNATVDETEYTTVPTYSGSTQTNYVVHPGFKFGDRELEGFWAIKFEPSNDGSGNIESLPAKVRYSNNHIGTAFNINLNMKLNTAKYGFSADEVDTHMSKTTEWGAITYLTQSVYGKNSAVFINNSSNNSTGCGGTLVDSAQYAGCQNAYNSPIGVEASTTGNIYGIYDMNGGSYEYMAAYVNNGHATLTTYGNNLLNGDPKYKVVYAPGAPDGEATNYNFNSTIIGDGLYETSSAPGIGSAWHNDRMYMPNVAAPFFGYGGFYSYGASSGIFGTICTDGSGSSNNTFRTILVVN